jgi:AcrR family transcriptional regulator
VRVRTEAKREAILTAASDVFREAGFEGASMTEIARRLGGSKGTLYGYFSSKEELFVAVVQGEADKQFEPVFTALNKEIDDLPKTLQLLGEKVMAYLCSASSIQARRAILAEAGRSDIGKCFHETGPKQGMQRIAVMLEKQMALGKLKKSPPLLVALQLSALLECETVVPLLLGIEKTLSKAQIKLAVSRALQTFFAAYGTDHTTAQ